MEYTIQIDKNVNRSELASLLEAVGFGSKYDDASLYKAICASSFIAYAIDHAGKLIGYLSALSDEVFTVFIDLVIVFPPFQLEGIGSALVKTVEMHFADIPMYVMPFEDQKKFFEKFGYLIPKRPMQALSKRNKF